MTSPVTPPAAPVVPLYPPLGSATFNADAYAYGTAMPSVVDGINALATNVYNNALAAEEGARVADLAGDRAATKAGEALASASSADAARLAAEAAYDSFDDRYLGAKSSDPATDNDGNPVVVGALYFRTTEPVGMKVKSASGWDDAYANLASKYDKTGGDIGGPVGVVGLLTVKSPSSGVAGRVSIQNSTGSTDLQIGKNDFISNVADISHTAPGGMLNISQSGAGTVNTLVNNAVVQEVTTAGVRVISGSLGYGVGSGGAVVQATSKSTAVTLNKPCGQITMHNESLAAGASVEFALNNTLLGPNDGLVVNPHGFVGYAVEVAYFLTATSVVLRVTNKGATRSDAVAIGFRIIKGATS